MTSLHNSTKHHKCGWPLDPFPQPELPVDYLAPAPGATHWLAAQMSAQDVDAHDPDL